MTLLNSYSVLKKQEEQPYVPNVYSSQYISLAIPWVTEACKHVVQFDLGLAYISGVNITNT